MNVIQLKPVKPRRLKYFYSYLEMARSIPNSIKQLSKGYQGKYYTPSEITKNCLERAENINSTFNSFSKITVDYAEELAYKSDKNIDERKQLGPLVGVPIAVTENFCTKGIGTMSAPMKLENFVPNFNATAVDRLEKQGIILIGKTKMDQFGVEPTKNPWGELDGENCRIAGESSAGSAIAVATGTCFGALGSDTDGSSRIPASYCGVVGYKPSYGLVSRYGLIPLQNTIDVPGILTRNVDDCSTILNAVAGPDNFDDLTTISANFKKFSLPSIEKLSVNGIRVGIPIEYHCEGLDPEILQTWTKVADLLENNGAQVSQISLPHTPLTIAAHTVLKQIENSSIINSGHRAEEDSPAKFQYTKTRAEGFDKEVIKRIHAGNYLFLKNNSHLFILRAQKLRKRIVRDFTNIFYANKSCDILLTPTTLTDAPVYNGYIESFDHDHRVFRDYCTQPANMSGVPAISIPIRLSSRGLPISLQLMGPSMGDQQLLTVAKWIESVVKFKGLV